MTSRAKLSSTCVCEGRIDQEMAQRLVVETPSPARLTSGWNVLEPLLSFVNTGAMVLTLQAQQSEQPGEA